MSNTKKDENSEPQHPASDHSQAEYFNDGRSNSAATRPPVGALSDPDLPGEPTPGNEELYDHPKEG
jgi:hypothetical protein